MATRQLKVVAARRRNLFLSFSLSLSLSLSERFSKQVSALVAVLLLSVATLVVSPTAADAQVLEQPCETVNEVGESFEPQLGCPEEPPVPQPDTEVVHCAYDHLIYGAKTDGPPGPFNDEVVIHADSYVDTCDVTMDSVSATADVASTDTGGTNHSDNSGNVQASASAEVTVQAVAWPRCREWTGAASIAWAENAHDGDGYQGSHGDSWGDAGCE